jgi:hypothetical protein
VGESDFEYAYSKVFPSVSVKTSRRYDRMYDTLRKARSRLDDPNTSNANTDTGTTGATGLAGGGLAIDGGMMDEGGARTGAGAGAGAAAGAEEGV